MPSPTEFMLAYIVLRLALKDSARAYKYTKRRVARAIRRRKK